MCLQLLPLVLVYNSCWNKHDVREWLLVKIKVLIYQFHIGIKPRYIPDKYKTKVSEWRIVGKFKSDHERDNTAINECTHFLAFDFNSNNDKISSTQKNIENVYHLVKLD